MYKYAFCEVFTKKLLPSIKLYIAYKLVSEYGFTQLEASRVLGVKQPLINYLLSGRRIPKYIELIHSNPVLKNIVDGLAEDISNNRLNPSTMSIACTICKALRESNILPMILEKLGYSINEVFMYK